jgi:hypothetical protein
MVEVRPKIRIVTPPSEVGQPKPTIFSAQELKPRVVGKTIEAPVTAKPPTVRTAQELKPRIVKAEKKED